MLEIRFSNLASHNILYKISGVNLKDCDDLFRGYLLEFELNKYVAFRIGVGLNT